MKNKKLAAVLFSLIPVTLLATFVASKILAGPVVVATDTVALKNVSENIIASGSIHSENEATLHFLTGGKLVYLPFKKGDTVYQGQVIAQLDTYVLQKQLEAALNTYRTTRDTFDQTKDNTQNNVLFGQLRYNIEVPSRSGITTGDVENTVINDMVKRLVDQNQAALDNSVIAVQLAQYAVDLSSLTAPFTGIVTGEDVTSANVAVTPATSFSIADPNAKVFRAQVAASDVDFVSVGNPAVVTLDGQKDKITGTVEKIYPQKITLPNGSSVYEVDVQADALNNTTVFGQNGSVVITSNNQSKALLVPAWAIINHHFVWVWENDHAVLKSVATGSMHDTAIEITSGLSKEDKVIVSPQTIAKLRYNIL